MGDLKRVLIMAGGTGGHVFPGLAVAELFRQQGVEVSWLGTQKGLEATLVPNAGFPLYFISISGIRGKRLTALIASPFRLILAIVQAIQLIHRIKPNIILGMGGFASGPGAIAGWLLRYPVIIHEQNAKPGTTNRWLAPVAKRVLEGFPNTFRSRRNVIVTGNPVRENITPATPPKRGKNQPLHLLVLGGSLGAVVLNELVPKALATIPSNHRPVVYHQTGKTHLACTIEQYHSVGLSEEVVPFIEKMDQAYAWADVVLCRAGALTVAELCAAGVGAILVPYPFAIDDHQTANANVMVKQGAARLVQQADLTVEKLADILLQFSQVPEQCQTMAKAAYALRQMEAAKKVLMTCEEVFSELDV